MRMKRLSLKHVIEYGKNNNVRVEKIGPRQIEVFHETNHGCVDVCETVGDALMAINNPIYEHKAELAHT